MDAKEKPSSITPDPRNARKRITERIRELQKEVDGIDEEIRKLKRALDRKAPTR